jgi:type II secretory pathway pseudopilin PulG
VRRRGFTILETLFAAGVLLFVMMAVLNILPSASLASKRADQQMTADSIAQSELERLRVASYDTLPATATSTTTVNGTEYRVDSAVADADPALGTTHAKQAVVTVSWIDPFPVAHRRDLKAQLYLWAGAR